jgi:hypothetical protein
VAQNLLTRRTMAKRVLLLVEDSGPSVLLPKTGAN